MPPDDCCVAHAAAAPRPSGESTLLLVPLPRFFMPTLNLDLPLSSPSSMQVWIASSLVPGSPGNMMRAAFGNVTGAPEHTGEDGRDERNGECSCMSLLALLASVCPLLLEPMWRSIVSVGGFPLTRGACLISSAAVYVLRGFPSLDFRRLSCFHALYRKAAPMCETSVTSTMTKNQSHDKLSTEALSHVAWIEGDLNLQTIGSRWRFCRLLASFRSCYTSLCSDPTNVTPRKTYAYANPLRPTI